MDPRAGEPLDLDRELAAALSVEPSVEFLARVRMRIAAEPEPQAWHPWRAIVAAAACAVAIAAAAAASHIGQMGLPSSSRLLADVSLLVPVIVPGPFAMAASSPRREEPTPELRAAMQSNAEANGAVAAHLAQRDYEAIVGDAATYRRNFAYIESFWATKQVDGAVGLSRSGLMAAADLGAAALAGDDAAIARAIAAMTAVCTACHVRYREELPDSTYAIKL
jgi:hypothetical protein